MGNTNESEYILQCYLYEIAHLTTLSLPEVTNLWKLFYKLSRSQRSDGVIDEEYFMTMFKGSNPFNQRLFTFIDINEDKVLNFKEWVEGFCRFKAGTNNQKVKLAMQILSGNKGYIEMEDICGLLRGSSYYLELHLTGYEILKIVQDDWPHRQSSIDLVCLRQLIEKEPKMLDWLYFSLE